MDLPINEKNPGSLASTAGHGVPGGQGPLRARPDGQSEHDRILRYTSGPLALDTGRTGAGTGDDGVLAASDGDFDADADVHTVSDHEDGGD